MSNGSKLVLALSALTMVCVVVIATAILTGGDADDALVSLEDLEEHGVMEFEEEHVFLVFNDGEPLALSDDPQHLQGEYVEWCESSQMFEAPTHGEKFDRLGNYYAGPAARGLARYPLYVEGGGVYVDLEDQIPGPERGADEVLEPEGPYCVTD